MKKTILILLFIIFMFGDVQAEQTATIALCNINRCVLYTRGGKCLLRGADCVLI
jgi:hypothetical protein